MSQGTLQGLEIFPKKILWMENGEIFGGAEMFSLDMFSFLYENFSSPIEIHYCFNSLHPRLEEELHLLQKKLPSHIILLLQKNNFPPLNEVSIKTLWKFFSATCSFRKKIEKEHYDVCYANTVRTAFLLSFGGIGILSKKYFFAHDYTAPKKWLRFGTKGFFKIFSCSYSVKNFLHQEGIVLEKIFTIENGVFPENFSFLPSSNFPPKKFGIIGQITEWKGQLTVLKAIKNLFAEYQNKQNPEIEQFQFYFFGEPSEKSKDQEFFIRLQHFILENKLEKNVFFQGFTPLKKALSGIDVLIQASESLEPFGRTPLEGAISEKLVLLSHIGTPAQIFENKKNALFFEAGNPEDLSEKIIWIQKNPEECKKIAHAGKNMVAQKFNLKDISKNFWKNF